MHLRPPIWRRLLVDSDSTLGQLHEILQIAMDWGDEHLHQFIVGRTTYADRRYLDDVGDREERKVRLAQVAPRPKDRFRYEYDFGDSWEHEIVVEAVKPPELGVRYPICTGGKRAGPPEDSGGVWGYADLIEALGDPRHPEHADMLEWFGGPIDPEAFDLEEINRRLARV
jgi:hypothetical protein